MPRAGDGSFTLAAGYQATDGQTATAAQHNDPLEDLETVLNENQPITKGGTGASSASGARTNLSVPGLSDNNTFSGDNTHTGTEEFDDDAFIVRDPSDATKKARFDAGGVTAGETRVLTLPDRDAYLAPPLLHVEDRKALNTIGGSFATGAWRTRDLNTVVTNEIAGASLATNQITLPAGTYECIASAPALDVNNHKTRLYNTTGTSLLLDGSSSYADNNTFTESRSWIFGRFTLSVESVLELQHYSSATSGGTTGFGTAMNQGTHETYTQVWIRRVV